MKADDYSYRAQATEIRNIRQGYITRQPQGTVRVRIANEEAFLTVKGANSGIERDEWEYTIPMADAMAMLERCCQGKVLEKTRYVIPEGGLKWEVDEFGGTNQGLRVAEIELPDGAEMPGMLPDFIGEEVTGDPRYYNSNL